MGKIDTKKINNLISHTNGSTNKNKPYFTKEILENLTKELYLDLIRTIKSFNNLDSSSFTKESLLNLVEDMINKNTILNEEYTNKYIQSIYDNNKIYNIFEGTLKATSNTFEEGLKTLENELIAETDEINTNLTKHQQDSVARYKSEENSFLPKTKFLSTNKKINKEEYIRIITEINQKRINSNQKYISIATDLSSINEQQQLKFKHSLESSTEKNIYDKTVITNNALEKLSALDASLTESEAKLRQIIQAKERTIVENTIKVNNLITSLGEQYSTRLKYAYVPYDIKGNKLIDELDENGRSYNIVEEQVLDEFKSMLQQNDNEIEELRLKHRAFQEQYLSSLREIKKTFNSAIQKEVNLMNKEIAAATKVYTSTLKKEDKDLVRRLVSNKKQYVKNQNKLKKEKIELIRKEYYEQELIYIEKFERLRTKKSQCEAIKSSAMKNINYERVYHHERINSEINLNTYEKESYSTIDHYEEIKDIYTNRLKCDIENENVRLEINEKELEIYTNKINIKYQKDKIEAEKEFNIMLCDADLIYQEETTKNRIDYYNVKTMLDIKRENLINEFEALFANEKMNFEQIKNIFYNNCDNIQYEIYKVANELTYKLIDMDVKLQQDLSEIKKQHVKALNNYKKKSLIYEKNYNENILHIKLYEDRLEVEKMMLTDAYNLFLNSMQNVIDLENFIHTNIHSLSKESFDLNKKELLIALEYIRKIKIRLIDEYYNHESSIIKMRLNFEADIKFKKQFENAKKDFLEFIEYSNQRTDKTQQTINSYKATIASSLTALKNTRKEIFNHHISLIKKTFNKKEKEILRKEILHHHEKLIVLKKQIKANLNNIKKMKRLAVKQERERFLKERKYNYRFKRIEKQQLIETKVYNNGLSLIESQYNQLKDEIAKCGPYLSISRYTYETAHSSSNYVITINNLVLTSAKHFFSVHYQKFDESLRAQYENQKNIYRKNFERNQKEIKRSVTIEIKEYQTNKLAIKNAHKSNVETLERQTIYNKNKLLIELKKLNSQHLIHLEEFNKKISQIEERKAYELACHDENYQMYLEKFNETNSKIINNYLSKIKEIKLNYKITLGNLESKYAKTLKSIKTQHINNSALQKNNILNLESEYKENTKKTSLKIKKINQKDKIKRQKHEESKRISFKLYLLNQRNTRKEFSAQLKLIERKCQRRINTLKKEFIKDFKSKKN